MSLRHLQQTPARMVEEKKSIAFGSYRTPFKNANLLDAPVYPTGAPRFWKNFRLKEWQHYGIITPAHYFGMVIFDAKFTAASFFYVYDRLRNKRFEHARQVRAGAVRIAKQMYDDFCRFESSDYRLSFENHLDRGFHRILPDIRKNHESPAIKGEIIVHEDLATVEPLVQVSPVTPYRPFYTHKAAVPASGSIRIDSTEIPLDRSTCIALIDEQKTYYPYSSFWKWGTAAGWTPEGALMAFNLCQNMMADDEEFNENCFWKDGRISFLAAARFEFADALKSWRMKTTDDRLDLSFVPSGERHGRMNIAGLIRSDFHQPFGLYNGVFRDENGIGHPVCDFFGLAEHHVTRY